MEKVIEGCINRIKGFNYDQTITQEESEEKNGKFQVKARSSKSPQEKKPIKRRNSRYVKKSEQKNKFKQKTEKRELAKKLKEGELEYIQEYVK